MTAAVLPVLVLFAASCSSPDPAPQTSTARTPADFDPATPYEPDVSADELTALVDNPLFPAPVGATWVYQAETEDGTERIEVSVLSETKNVWGATARVVRDTVTVDGELAEDTWDWYAEDGEGNVWYLGEDTAEYEDGEEVCRCGAWESGVDGALPGVVMLAAPEIGDSYRQEYLAGEAEDYAEVVSLSETVTVPAGTFEGCLKTHDQSAIEPGLDEFKYYCPGVGNVLVEEGDVRVELIEVSGL
jgi:hypothetical protein